MSVRMQCKTLGEGHPFVILHGLYGMSENWLPIAKILSSNYKVFLPDWRNHGYSPHTQSHTYEDLISDLKYFTGLEDLNIST